MGMLIGTDSIEDIEFAVWLILSHVKQRKSLLSVSQNMRSCRLAKVARKSPFFNPIEYFSCEIFWFKRYTPYSRTFDGGMIRQNSGYLKAKNENYFSLKQSWEIFTFCLSMEELWCCQWSLIVSLRTWFDCVEEYQESYKETKKVQRMQYESRRETHFEIIITAWAAFPRAIDISVGVDCVASMYASASGK